MDKETIKMTIEYLYNVSLKKPINVRLEEVELGRIVLSYSNEDTFWSDRIYKEFIIEDNQVKSMKVFDNNKI